MCYYFNVGLDSKIGLDVERNRQKKRCCNYIMYALYGFRNWIGREYTDARTQIKTVSTVKTLPNGLKQSKIVTDMDKLSQAPWNVCGFNLNSCYGNLVSTHTWEKSKDRIMDPGKVLRNHKMNIIQTSCDESDSKLVQRIDDDKIELMCTLNPLDFLDGQMGRLGQVRSPFEIAF
jgi:hypothetical protein